MQSWSLWAEHSSLGAEVTPAPLFILFSELPYTSADLAEREAPAQEPVLNVFFKQIILYSYLFWRMYKYLLLIDKNAPEAVNKLSLLLN